MASIRNSYILPYALIGGAATYLVHLAGATWEVVPIGVVLGVGCGRIRDLNLENQAFTKVVKMDQSGNKIEEIVETKDHGEARLALKGVAVWTLGVPLLLVTGAVVLLASRRGDSSARS